MDIGSGWLSNVSVDGRGVFCTVEGAYVVTLKREDGGMYCGSGSSVMGVETFCSCSRKLRSMFAMVPSSRSHPPGTGDSLGDDAFRAKVLVAADWDTTTGSGVTLMGDCMRGVLFALLLVMTAWMLAAG